LTPIKTRWWLNFRSGTFGAILKVVNIALVGAKPECSGVSWRGETFDVLHTFVREWSVAKFACWIGWLQASGNHFTCRIEQIDNRDATDWIVGKCFLLHRMINQLAQNAKWGGGGGRTYIVLLDNISKRDWAIENVDPQSIDIARVHLIQCATEMAKFDEITKCLVEVESAKLSQRSSWSCSSRWQAIDSWDEQPNGE